MKVMRNHDDAATELKEICTAAADLNARLEDWNRNVPMPLSAGIVSSFVLLLDTRDPVRGT